MEKALRAPETMVCDFSTGKSYGWKNAILQHFSSEIHKIFIKRIGFTLIRVHRQQNVTASLGENEILLQNLKWPIECMFVGLRPQSQKNDLAHWHKFTKQTETAFDVPGLLADETVFADGTGAYVGKYVLDVADRAQVKADVSTKTIDRLTISAHGIFLYNDMPSEFFHQYTTYTYGGPHIQTPEDEGALMIPFNLYQGTYQPSGHVNVSRAREFYIKYSSSVIGQLVSGSPITGELVIKIATVTNRQMPRKLDSTLARVNIESESHRYNCLVAA